MIKASKVEITITNSDGTHTTLTSLMPQEVAQDLIEDAMHWKIKYSSTFKDVEEYLKYEHQYKSK